MNHDETGAKLLRKYRFYDIDSFLLRRKLEEELENFVYRYFDEPIGFEVFLNDSGKYIVFYNWSKQHFPKQLIDDLCKEYNVTFESETVEYCTDYEGNTSKGQITYLFEIVKDY